MKALFDTNILIDYLNGREEAAAQFRHYSERLISQITWMEVMVGCRDAEEERQVRAFLAGFTCLPVNADVAEAAVLARRHDRLRLPDAIILATAQTAGALLVTRDGKNFGDRPEVRVPY